MIEKGQVWFTDAGARMTVTRVAADHAWADISVEQPDHDTWAQRVALRDGTLPFTALAPTPALQSALEAARSAPDPVAAVRAWSLRVHGPANERHAWAIAAARAILAGDPPPRFPSRMRATHDSRVDTVKRLLGRARR